MLDLLRRISIFLSILFYIFLNYNGLLFSFSAYLFFFFLTHSRINARIFSLFFLAYFLIPFLNISNYRGTITINTLAVYSFTQFCILKFIVLIEKSPNKSNFNLKEIYKPKESTYILFYGHLLIVYLSIAYVYATIGFIIIRQDLRFNIPPTLEYIIKSGLALPLIWLYSTDFKLTLKNVVLKLFLPLLPSLLIGSRGTFIMILISFIVSLYLLSKYGNYYFWNKYKFFFKNSKKLLIVGGFIGVFALYSGFYIRRSGADLVSVDQLFSKYQIQGNSIWINAILPIYLNLRETIGITNRIIEQNISNSYYPYPFFIAELVTVLPGSQDPPGRVLGEQIFLTKDYGLTPGIIGGLFIDYGYLFILIILFLIFIVISFFNRAMSSIKYSLLYSFTLVQFFHLYHRGFLKVEYLFPYLVIFVYLSTMKKIKIDLDR